MEIRRLKLSGFKSFVDAAELRIEPGLTGIVGPNGCGKSNLLEAIRWVMGETSSRAMRSGGMEDVIFAGTATRPQRDFAEVTIHATQEPGETLPAIDIAADGEVEIIRRIERGSGSAYRANGRDVRAKDVALLFADAATGAHSPALVSQGKIAAVIAARPQERRAMLEEAAGISGLHVRRKDAEQKLRAAETNLSRLDEILADMDARAASLRRQARAAERYTRLSADIRLTEGRLLFARWREAAETAEAAQAEATKAQAETDRAQTTLAGATTALQAAVATLAEARAQAQNARDAVHDGGHRLAALRAEREQTVRRVGELASQTARLAEDNAREDSLAHDAAEAISRLQSEVTDLKGRIAQAEAQMPDRARRISEARDDARDAELNLAKAMARQASEQAELRVAQAALAAASNRLDRAERDKARLEAEQSALPDAAPLVRQRDAAKADIARAEADREATESALSQAEQARTAATQERARSEAGAAAARAALAALDAEVAALTKALAADAGGGARLIDQLRAAPGYEHALAAALGDDIEATLDRANGWTGAEAQPGDPPLPAHTTPLATYVDAPAALSRRLAQIGVVETDTGEPLATGQRLVTRAGYMRRWDGFVVNEGAAATAQRLIRRNRLDALERQRPELDDRAKTADAAVAQARAALDEATQQIAAMQAKLVTAQRDHAQAVRTRDDAAAALDRLAARATDSARRLSEARADHAQMLQEQEAAQQRLADLPAGNATQDEVTALSQANERTRQHVSELQADVSLAERALTADKERLAAADSEIRGWRTRSGEAARRIADMAARAKALTAEQEALVGKPEALAAQIATLEQETAALSATAETSAQAERSAETDLRGKEKEQEDAGEALAQARERRAAALARAEAAQQRRIEVGQEAGERFECPAPVLPERMGFTGAEAGTAATNQTELDRLTAERERLGPVNLVAASELAELEAQQGTSRTESAELTQAIHQLRGSIGSLNREGRTRLMAAFEAVDGHFRRLFTALFNGGEARLELVESDDPLEAGLEILAQPPGKRLSTLTLLSGGEQALTAVALIFGLFLTNPAPICVLDEVDAPLDDANVERFCDLLDQMVQDTRTRYLIVTHNAVTMSRMHRLFGVTMVEKGVSRLVSVDLGGAEQLLAAE